MKSARSLMLAIASAVLLSPLAARAQYVPITGFAKSATIHQNLFPTFLTGNFTDNGAFGTPFSVVADGNGHDYAEVYTTLTVDVSPLGLTNVSHVYALMNAYAPNFGAPIAKVDFIGAASTDVSFTLVNGTDIRDFYQGSYANTINGATSRNVYTGIGQGGGGSGNVGTGLVGSYVQDELDFDLGNAFATEQLQTIQITPLGNGTALLLGATAVVPEPSSSMLAVVPAAAAVLGRRRRRA